MKKAWIASCVLATLAFAPMTAAQGNGQVGKAAADSSRSARNNYWRAGFVVGAVALATTAAILASGSNGGTGGAAHSH